jgi:hypothetical protein
MKTKPALTFQVFGSSCIDLGHYDGRKKQLTVRFINPDPRRFYRYSSVPMSKWKKLNSLNQRGGVGTYLNETLVQHPEKYPVQEISIPSFQAVLKSKKPKT